MKRKYVKKCLFLCSLNKQKMKGKKIKKKLVYFIWLDRKIKQKKVLFYEMTNLLLYKSITNLNLHF